MIQRGRKRPRGLGSFLRKNPQFYRDSLMRVMRLRRVSEADAEDIAQEAFLKGFEHAAQLKDARRLLPWLYQIARNIHLVRLKRGKGEGIRVVMEEKGSLATSHRSGLPGPDEALRVKDIYKVIGRLPPLFREILAVAAREKELAQIARALGITESAAKSRLWRARQALRMKLGELDRKPRKSVVAAAHQTTIPYTPEQKKLLDHIEKWLGPDRMIPMALRSFKNLQLILDLPEALVAEELGSILRFYPEWVDGVVEAVKAGRPSEQVLAKAA